MIPSTERLKADRSLGFFFFGTVISRFPCAARAARAVCDRVVGLPLPLAATACAATARVAAAACDRVVGLVVVADPGDVVACTIPRSSEMGVDGVAGGSRDLRFLNVDVDAMFPSIVVRSSGRPVVRSFDATDCDDEVERLDETSRRLDARRFLGNWLVGWLVGWLDGWMTRS